MDFLHGLAVFLFCLVGYSGAVVRWTARDPPSRPAGWELLLTGIIGVIAVTVAPELAGHWLALPLAAAVGAVPGALVGFVRRTRRGGSGGKGRSVAGASPLHRQLSAGESSRMGRFRAYLLRVGEYQGRVAMGYLYYLLLAPFAMVSRLFDDPLEPERRDGGFWTDRSEAPRTDGDEPLTRQY